MEKFYLCLSEVIKMCVFFQPFGYGIRYNIETAPEKGKS